MAAAIFDDSHLGDARNLLVKLRADLGRKPADMLHWKNIKAHAQRVHAAKTLGETPWLTIATVVVCKRHIRSDAPAIDEHMAYMWTFRLLLERLSWFARDKGKQVDITLAHVRHFPTSKLRQYEHRLRAAETKVDWKSIGGPCAIDQPIRVEPLQIADLAVSATGTGFNPDSFNNTEPRYTQELAPRLYRRGTAALTSYGLKVHPWNDKTQEAFPWVLSL